MIDITCECGTPLRAAEAEANLAIACPKCRKTIRPVSAEQLPAGAGAGDFDTRLVITEGPARVGEQLPLGGCIPIELGKQPERHVPLTGKMVSRLHCTLTRLDFGPSRWKVVDNKSTNGLYVNGTRVTEHELRDGDEITVGDYTLKFLSDAARPEAVAAPLPAIPVGGPTCPSCGKQLPADTLICVDCGIYVDTGKPLVTSKGFDEDEMAGRADTWIRLVSWVVPLGFFPVASEAYGSRTPVTTWVVTVLTIVVSFAYFPAIWGAETYKDMSAASMKMMHWTGSRDESVEELGEVVAPEIDVEPPAPERPAPRGAQLAATPAPEPPPGPTPEQVDAYLVEEGHLPPKDVGFRCYQLFTHALIHADLMHLAGNLLFLFVFGMRVNELIGNLYAAIVYPLLAVGSALIDAWVHADGPMQSGLGASGAIMGLAGMYFVLFPVQKVHMAIWARWFWLFLPLIFYVGIRVSYKTFVVGGFWMLLLWVGWNDVLPTLIGSEDGVGHWAHLGGFLVGMVLALTLLLTRQVNARGADLLSVTLGKYAWALVGKPTTRKDPPPTPRAVSLNYGG